VSQSSGWNPFNSASGTASEHFIAGPFTRLARTHALAVAGDALIALSLADSVFFSNPGEGARTSVALYLLLTMAPFAFVAPLIGPALDRAKGGRRMTVVVGNAMRTIVVVFMMGHLDSPLFYPEAFALLVLAKGYSIAKSAIVPTTVRTDTELVQANAKLSIITGLAGLAAGIPGAIALLIGGPSWTLALAAIVFSAAAITAMRLPNEAIATEPPGEAETAELHSTLIRLSASAMGLMRGVVGFLAFLLAFSVSDGDAPTWYLGAALIASVAGSFTGSIVAPRVRETTREEDIFVGSLGIAAIFGLFCAWTGGLLAFVLMPFAIGFSANTAKLAFDSLVQRDAPDANRGRSFARFETRFQIAWVLGALLGVVSLPPWAGYLIISATMSFAVASYVIGSRKARAANKAESPRAPTRAPSDDAPGPQRKRRTNTRGRSERPPTEAQPETPKRPRAPRLPGPATRKKRP
jgi:MFS family permease